jgi:hypothetical protein
MSLSRTLILGTILILLGGYVYELKWQNKESKVARIFIFDPLKVEEIRLVKAGHTITLRKKDREWGVLGRVEGSGRPLEDGRIIRNLLSVFDYGIIDVIDNNPTNLVDYGLDKPRLEFGIKMEGDPSYRYLLIGDSSPVNNACYGKAKGLPEVYLLGILYKTDLEASFDLIRLNAYGKT